MAKSGKTSKIAPSGPQNDMNIAQSIDQIETALRNGEPDKALRLAAICEASGVENARMFCLKGKAHMKQSDWHKAQSAFLHADELQPNGPAAQYLSMLTDIMDFYNKDMYNQ